LNSELYKCAGDLFNDGLLDFLNGRIVGRMEKQYCHIYIKYR
jgi:hypothetical protein